MRHMGQISKSSIPRYAVPVVTSKDGCKANVSGSEVLTCKTAVKKDGSYPLSN